MGGGGAQPEAGGEGGAATPALSPEEDIKLLEQQLATIKDNLEAAKRRQKEKEARDNAHNAIDTQRATTAQVIEAAKKLYDDWQKQVEAKVTNADRTAIQEHINEADNALATATADVAKLDGERVAAEQALKNANEAVDKAKKEYSDEQAKLAKLNTDVKEPPAKINKLKADVKSAVESGNWRLAYYRNFRLKRALDNAETLVNSANTEAKKIEDKLVELLDALTTKENEAKAEQQALNQKKDDLKNAQQRQKEKQDGLESAITNIL